MVLLFTTRPSLGGHWSTTGGLYTTTEISDVAAAIAQYSAVGTRLHDRYDYCGHVGKEIASFDGELSDA